MATYYIDPSQFSNGTGTEESPFNSWDSVTWAPNNTYLQKAGTTFLGQVSINANGPITLGKYGDGALPIINAMGDTYAIHNRYRSNITIEDFELTGAALDGLLIEGYGSNINTNRVRRCKSHDNLRNGFHLDSVTLTCYVNDIIYEDCHGYKNARHGFDTLGIVTNVTYINSTAYENGWGEPGHGFSLHPFSTIVTSGWTVVSGNVYSRTLAADEYVQKLINRDTDTTLTNNTSTPTNPALNEWGQSGTTLYVNVGSNPNGASFAWKRAPHGPFFYYNCSAWKNISIPTTAGEGHGFAADDITSDAFYQSCLSFNNKGAGFQCQWTSNITHIGCIAVNNELSNFRTTGNTDGITQKHCTSVSSVQHGYLFDTPLTNVTLQNCIAYKNGKGIAGFFGIVGSGVVTTDCNVFGSAGTTNGTSNTRLTTNDPKLNLYYQPTSTSPIINLGSFVGNLQDYTRKSVWTSPTIGAYEYVRPRTAASTRTMRT